MPATSLLVVGDAFIILEPILLPNTICGDCFKIIEMHDWNTTRTYTMRRCNAEGKEEALSRPQVIGSSEIDRYIIANKIAKLPEVAKDVENV